MSAAASTEFGPYTLLHQLGAGGMGTVFLARHKGEHEIERLVALKRILGHLSNKKQLVQLFLDEVRIAAQLTHGNIVQVIDHGVISDQYYMAMEYVHGENLAEVIDRLSDMNVTVPLDLLLYVASCACQGLDYAHHKQGLDGRPLGLVHRDITPHNIMISFQGEVKIADFGVAHATKASNITTSSAMGGKISYMSPEQSRGEALDHRSDIFSLGIVLYEALTACNPFIRDNVRSTLEAIRTGDARPLQDFRQDVPPELELLVNSALSPDPEKRPQSAREMYKSLQEIIRRQRHTVGAFDLADYLQDLFPESDIAESSWEESTEVGRRADKSLVPEQSLSQLSAVERRTLLYLQTRRPDGITGTASQLLAPLTDRSAGVASGKSPAPLDPLSTTAGVRQVRGGSNKAAWIIGICILVGAGLAAGLVLRKQSPTPPTPPANRPVAKPTPQDAGRPPIDSTSQATPDMPAAPVASRGTLQVSVSPANATVFVGSRRVGRGNRKLTLPAGTHQIRAVLSGYRTVRRTITLAAKQNKRVALRLSSSSGRLVLSSSHPCTLTVDGKPANAGTMALSAGRHTVSCTNRGLGIRAKKKVRVPSGGAARVAFRFGVVMINVQPWAKVSVGGRSRGTTPLRLLLPAGEHRVTLSNPKAGKKRNVFVKVKAKGRTRISHW